MNLTTILGIIAIIVIFAAIGIMLSVYLTEKCDSCPYKEQCKLNQDNKFCPPCVKGLYNQNTSELC